MPLIEIDEVHLAAFDGPVADAYVDSPRVGATSEHFNFPLVGWVLGRDGPVTELRLTSIGVTIATTPVDHYRADLVAAFPGVPWANRCAFTSRVPAVSLPRRFEVVLQGRTGASESWTTFAAVKGRRAALPHTFVPTIQPLVLATVGRTGSTWMTLLLNELPGVTACRPFHYETRVANYWISVLRTLCHPASHQQMIAAEMTPGLWWTGRERRTAIPPRLPDEPLAALLGRDAVPAATDFCMQQTEAFFRRVAEMRGRTDVRYFAEKYAPHPLLSQMVHELYPESKQIFLVRDFRDVICSVIRYNPRGDYDPFGIGRAGGELAFIAEHAERGQALRAAWEACAGDAHLVRYEDLIADPVRVLEGVTAFLGVAATREQIERGVAAASRAEADLQLSHQTSGSVAESVGRWRRDLDPRWYATCRELLDGFNTAFGYEATPDPPAGRPGSEGGISLTVA